MRMIKREKISKREAVKIRTVAILGSLILSGLFIFLLGHNPVDVYISMAKGAFGSLYRIKDTINIIIPLIMTSLGIMIAFKMKFWNIGGEGQILIGALFASYIALNFSNLPKPVLLPIMFLAGFMGGGFWAFIPALLKVKFQTNETIITLMMNYIALNIITYLQYGPWRDPQSLGFPKISSFAESALLPDVLGIHMGWIVTVLTVVLVTVFMNKTKFGYEIKVVGESKDTANYSGIRVNRVVLRGLIISGGICGIVGMMEVSGVNGTLTNHVSAGYGYTAIITAWLSGLKPAFIIPVSALFAGLIKGGGFIQTAYQIPQSAADIIQSMILFFVIGSEFFIQYKLVPDKRNDKGGNINVS
ncbi:MAG: ABC transporter permease [Eubacteriales bacterium]